MLSDRDEPTKQLIKRYSMARLYDTSRLAYVDVAQIRAFAQAGDEVVVVDAEDGTDITADLLRLGR